MRGRLRVLVLVPAGRMIGILLAFLLAAAAATTLAFGLFAALTAVLATLLELVRATPALSARSIEGLLLPLTTATPILVAVARAMAIRASSSTIRARRSRRRMLGHLVPPFPAPCHFNDPSLASGSHLPREPGLVFFANDFRIGPKAHDLKRLATSVCHGFIRRLSRCAAASRLLHVFQSHYFRPQRKCRKSLTAS